MFSGIFFGAADWTDKTNVGSAYKCAMEFEKDQNIYNEYELSSEFKAQSTKRVCWKLFEIILLDWR